MTGVAMVQSGMSTVEALAMTLLVFAGSSQLAAIPLIAASAPVWVILATSFTAEGEATAHAISEALKSRGILVTRLARGVPIGSELEYVDLGTIAHALVDRR